jgi:hypothetical protein
MFERRQIIFGTGVRRVVQQIGHFSRLRDVYGNEKKKRAPPAFAVGFPTGEGVRQASRLARFA